MAIAPLLPPEEGRVENFCSVPPLAPLSSPVGSRVRSEDAMPSPAPPAQPWSQVSVAPHTQTPLRDALPFESGPWAPLRCPTAGTSMSPLVPLVRPLGAWLELPRPSRWLLRTIRLGYAIQFARRPPKFRGNRFTSVLSQDAPVLRAEVAVLLAKDAIQPAPPAKMESGLYKGPYFIVPKKHGGLHPIWDLRVLNRALVKLPFKMLTQRRLFQCVRPFDWVAAIDLKDAYFHVSILPRFRFAYKGASIPVGPPLRAPQPVGASGQPGKEQTLPYAEDLFSRQGVGLGQPHSTSLRGACSVNAEMPGVSPAQEGGSTETFSEAPGAYGILSRYHAARIASYETASALASRPSPEMGMAPRHIPGLTHPVLPSHLQPMVGSCFLRAEVPLEQVSRHVVVSTDASATGWGAMCNGHAAAGLWTGPQLQWHINCLELLAVWLALRRFRTLLHEKHILVRSDNTATVAYINHQGGLRSRRMSQLARQSGCTIGVRLLPSARGWMIGSWGRRPNVGNRPRFRSSRKCMRRWLGLGRHLFLPEAGLVPPPSSPPSTAERPRGMWRSPQSSAPLPCFTASPQCWARMPLSCVQKSRSYWRRTRYSRPLQPRWSQGSTKAPTSSFPRNTVGYIQSGTCVFWTGPLSSSRSRCWRRDASFNASVPSIGLQRSTWKTPTSMSRSSLDSALRTKGRAYQ